MDPGLMDFVHSIIDLLKFCFNYHWLLGIFIIILLFALLAYVLLFLLLYFVFWAFNTGHYVWGSIGVLFLVYSYWQGKKKDRLPSQQDAGSATTSKEEGCAASTQETPFDSQEKERLGEDHAQKEETKQQYRSYEKQKSTSFENDELADSYRVLGCRQDASFASIQQAYRRLAKEYHPDSFANKPQEFIELATRKMQEINLAYQQICEARGERR